MGEKSQDVMKEMARWEQETGYSAEAVYNTHPSEPFTNLTDEQRERGVGLWKRYQEAWEAEQTPKAPRPLGTTTTTERMTCPSCGGTGQLKRLASGPPPPCPTCGGFGEINRD